MTRYIEQQDSSGGPLCLNMSSPLHQLAMKMLNAMYEVMDRDENSESPPEQERIYQAAQDAAPEQMQLYLTTSSPSILGQGSSYARAGVTIESWFFQCPTCELILPANGVTRR